MAHTRNHFGNCPEVAIEFRSRSRSMWFSFCGRHEARSMLCFATKISFSLWSKGEQTWHAAGMPWCVFLISRSCFSPVFSSWNVIFSHHSAWVAQPPHVPGRPAAGVSQLLVMPTSWSLANFGPAFNHVQKSDWSSLIVDMRVSWNGGTPSHHLFLDGIFPYKYHPAIGVPPWLWNPIQ